MNNVIKYFGDKKNTSFIRDIDISPTQTGT